MVDTDACDRQIGSLLPQNYSVGHENSIGLWFRLQTDAEHAYETIHQYCFVVMWSVPMLSAYGEATHFPTKTDHNTLKWALNLADAISRLDQWHLSLCEMEFDVLFRAKSTRQAVDTSSRLPTRGEDRPALNDVLLFMSVVSSSREDAKVCIETTERIDSYDDTGCHSILFGSITVCLDINSKPGTSRSPTRRSELLAEQAKDPYCRQVASTVSRLHLSYLYDCHGSWFALHRLMERQKRWYQTVLDNTCYSSLIFDNVSNTPGERCMHDTIRCQLYW